MFVAVRLGSLASHTRQIEEIHCVGRTIREQALQRISLFFFRVTGRMEEDESLTRQVMSMVLENQALFPYLVGWAAFNVVILILLVYIAIRLTLGQK
jgi:hypothetical protein